MPDALLDRVDTIVHNYNATLERETPALDNLAVNLSGKLRRETLHGKTYLVAPMRMIVPGVLNGSKGPILYTSEENTKNFTAWNNMPIVVNHPMDLGRPVSARSPKVLEKYGIGFVFNSVAGKYLDAEGWFDVEATRRIEPRILDSLEAGRPIELSTGLFMDYDPAPENAVFNGVSYKFIARNYRPDHLAVLPDQTGACSLSDGCGVLVNKKNKLTVRGLLTQIAEVIANYNPSQPRDNRGRWSGGGSGGGSSSGKSGGGSSRAVYGNLTDQLDELSREGGFKNHEDMLQHLPGYSGSEENYPGGEFQGIHEDADILSTAKDLVQEAKAAKGAAGNDKTPVSVFDGMSAAEQANYAARKTAEKAKSQQKPSRKQQAAQLNDAYVSSKSANQASIALKNQDGGLKGASAEQHQAAQAAHAAAAEKFRNLGHKEVADSHQQNADLHGKLADRANKIQASGQSLSDVNKGISGDEAYERQSAKLDSKSNDRAQAMAELIKEAKAKGGSVRDVTAADLKQRIKDNAAKPTSFASLQSDAFIKKMEGRGASRKQQASQLTAAYQASKNANAISTTLKNQEGGIRGASAAQHKEAQTAHEAAAQHFRNLKQLDVAASHAEAARIHSSFSGRAAMSEELSKKVRPIPTKPIGTGTTIQKGPVKTSNITTGDLEASTGGKVIHSRSTQFTGTFNPTTSHTNFHKVEHSEPHEAITKYAQELEKSGMSVSQISSTMKGYQITVRDLEKGIHDHIEFRKSPTTNKLVNRVASILVAQRRP